jgi:hypothetical protein
MNTTRINGRISKDFSKKILHVCYVRDILFAHCRSGDLFAPTWQVVVSKWTIWEMMYLSASTYQVYVLMMHLTLWKTYFHVFSNAWDILFTFSALFMHRKRTGLIKMGSLWYLLQKQEHRSNYYVVFLLDNFLDSNWHDLSF